MNKHNAPSQRGPIGLSPEDAELLDQLLAGQTSPESGQEAGQKAGLEPSRQERLAALRRVLAVLDRWEAEDPGAALSGKAMAAIVGTTPVPLSQADGEALDALLAIRQRGLETGPMPADSRERAEVLTRLLRVLDGQTADEAVPAGLIDRTMDAIKRDRAVLGRISAAQASEFGGETGKPTFGGLRQIATTAALVLMSLSVLLPVLSQGRDDARVIACSQNLAGLGTDLQRYANDRDEQTDYLGEVFGPSQLDGTVVPRSEASVFLLVDEAQADPQALECPSAPDPATAYYNGQNPAAGGPVRAFLEPRPIFADTNPLYDVSDDLLVRSKAGELSMSANHGGDGQNVLISDGSVNWLIRPTVSTRQHAGDDNIWLMRPAVHDADEPDVFLTP